MKYAYCELLLFFMYSVFKVVLISINSFLLNKSNNYILSLIFSVETDFT